MVVGDVNVLADLAYAPVAFVLGAHPGREVRRLGLVGAVLGVVGAGAWAATHTARTSGTGSPALSGAAMATAAAVVLLGGWLGGYVRWQRREGLRARVEASLRAAEERRLRDLVTLEQERVRIATDMHDVIAHSWAVVAAQADGARYTLRGDPDRAEDALAVIGETARTAMDDVRGLLTRLRAPDANEPAGLDLHRPDALLQRMRASGMTLDLERTGDPGRRPDVAAAALAEALTNALKHGDLTAPVRVEEAWDAGYRLLVANAVSRPGPPGSGHGLRGMRERVEATGGRMVAGPEEDGRTWVVRLELPEPQESR
ncbi:MAG: two-component sensor histidine kinase [Micrococcales bacterium]|nr:two-component sensor histidine kinase [Micrococcales bacterium]